MRTSMGLSPPGPPRCLPSSQFRFWSHCFAPSGRSRVSCFNSSCSSGPRFRRRFWCARSRRGARGKFRCEATTSGRPQLVRGLKGSRSLSSAFVQSTARLHTPSAGQSLRAAFGDSAGRRCDGGVSERSRRIAGNKVNFFLTFSAGEQTLSVHGFANVAKRASPAVNGSRYVPDLCRFPLWRRCFVCWSRSTGRCTSRSCSLAPPFRRRFGCVRSKPGAARRRR